MDIIQHGINIHLCADEPQWSATKPEHPRADPEESAVFGHLSTGIPSLLPWKQGDKGLFCIWTVWKRARTWTAAARPAPNFTD